MGSSSTRFGVKIKLFETATLENCGQHGHQLDFKFLEFAKGHNDWKKFQKMLSQMVVGWCFAMKFSEHVNCTIMAGQPQPPLTYASPCLVKGNQSLIRPYFFWGVGTLGGIGWLAINKLNDFFLSLDIQVNNKTSRWFRCLDSNDYVWVLRVQSYPVALRSVLVSA